MKIKAFISEINDVVKNQNITDKFRQLLNDFSKEELNASFDLPKTNPHHLPLGKYSLAEYVLTIYLKHIDDKPLCASLCELMTVLLNAGINPNSKNDQDFSLLHLLARHNFVRHEKANIEHTMSMVSVLEQNGADFNIKDNLGDTPAMSAAKMGNYFCIIPFWNLGAGFNIWSKGISNGQPETIYDILLTRGDLIAKAVCNEAVLRGARTYEELTNVASSMKKDSLVKRPFEDEYEDSLFGADYLVHRCVEAEYALPLTDLARWCNRIDLTRKNTKGESIIDITIRDGRAYELYENPVILNAIKSQFPYDDYRRFLQAALTPKPIADFSAFLDVIPGQQEQKDMCESEQSQQQVVPGYFKFFQPKAEGHKTIDATEPAIAKHLVKIKAACSMSSSKSFDKAIKSLFEDLDSSLHSLDAFSQQLNEAVSQHGFNGRTQSNFNNYLRVWLEEEAKLNASKIGLGA